MRFIMETRQEPGITSNAQVSISVRDSQFSNVYKTRYRLTMLQKQTIGGRNMDCIDMCSLEKHLLTFSILDVLTISTHRSDLSVLRNPIAK